VSIARIIADGFNPVSGGAEPVAAEFGETLYAAGSGCDGLVSELCCASPPIGSNVRGDPELVGGEPCGEIVALPATGLEPALAPVAAGVERFSNGDRLVPMLPGAVLPASAVGAAAPKPVWPAGGGGYRLSAAADWLIRKTPITSARANMLRPPCEKNPLQN
jgi:hypothetical protein